MKLGPGTDFTIDLSLVSAQSLDFCRKFLEILS